MYPFKALLLAFLAGVILAGGVTFVLVRTSPASAGVMAGCPGGPATLPAAVPDKDWDYTRPASTTGGVRPTELQNHPRPIGSGH